MFWVKIVNIADESSHADSASTADSFGGRDKTSWESYIQNTAKSAGESPIIQTGTWYVNNSSNASNMKGSICAGGHNKRIYQAPNKNGYWYSLANLRGSVFFPPFLLQLTLLSFQMCALLLLQFV